MLPIILYISAVWFYSSLQIKCLSVQKRAIDRFVVRLITQFHSIQFHSIPFHYNSRQQSIQIIDSFRSHFFYSHFYILAFNDFSVFVFNGRQNMNCLLGTKAASSVRWYSIPPPHKNEYHIRDARKEIRNDLLLNKNFAAAAAAYKLHIAHTYTQPNGSIIEHHPIAEPNTLFCCDPRVWVKQVSKQAVCFCMNAWILASLCRVSGECVRACVSEWVSDWMSVHVYVHPSVSVSLYVCMYVCVCSEVKCNSTNDNNKTETNTIRHIVCALGILLAMDT